jgi:hypothetical protein
MRHFTIVQCASLAVGIIAGVAPGLAAGAARPGFDQSKPAATPSVSGVDACTLLTREDAATAVGGTVGEGKSTDVKGGGLPAKGCSYEGSGLNQITLNMFLFAPGSPEVQVYRGLCAQKEQVAGLGDIACWYDGKHRELQALKGSTVMLIQVTRSGDASEPLKAAMKKVIDRLPAK